MEPLRRPSSSVPAPLFIEIRAAWRMLRLFLHLVCGSASIRFATPRMSGPRLARFKQRWSIKLLKILGLRLHAEAVDMPARALFVSNHISWLDVFVISAVTPAHFVCKDDIRKWPIIGWLLAATETIFIARSNRADAARTAKSLAERLQRNEPVAFFPEGTT
ncbi:MAG: acyltransferase family protein, partial [Rhodocyclales bacterium]|nr:acyltransferase family protein [Rhodocyclales bacterium]